VQKLTFGWILENDRERFFERTEDFPNPRKERVPQLHCPYCSAQFSNPRDLDDHIFAEHRIERPALLIDGREATAETKLLRSRKPSAFAFPNATKAYLSQDNVEEQLFSIDSLAASLADCRQQEIRLRLVNDSQREAAPVETNYRLLFRIADHDELLAVERAFIDRFIGTRITRRRIGEFLEDPKLPRNAKAYTDALGQYCLGLLIKEAPEGEDITVAVERYRELYVEAAAVLSRINRPLASLLVNLIRFSLNEFADHAIKTGFGHLDLAVELITEPEGFDLPVLIRSDGRTPVCPIDHVTDEILELATSLTSKTRWSGRLTEKCRSIVQRDGLDPDDKNKVYAIWAAVSWKLEEYDVAREPLSRIAEVHPFKRWASGIFEHI
jgi:hypothetical protein